MKTYDTLISEFRTDYQVAPYVSIETLTRLADEGEAALSRLVLSTDFDKDLIARSLLKNYMYYAMNHVTNEFWDNYRADILRWQWEHEETETGAAAAADAGENKEDDAE